MRACARVALASIVVSASISLSGCAAIEELKETFLRWVESQKLPSADVVSADQLPEATPVVPPDNTPKEASKRPPQPKHAARKVQRQTVVLPPRKPPIPNSTEAVVLPPKKPPIPIRRSRRGRKAPRANPRRLSLRRGGCLVGGPKHRHPDVFHVKIGHGPAREPSHTSAMAAFAKNWRRE
jgi:hypothetical protein